MKLNTLVALILVLSTCRVSFGQGHRTHDTEISADTEAKQGKAPSGQLSDLIRDGERAMGIIGQAVGHQDAHRLDRAVDSYMAVLTEIRAAMRLGDQSSENFKKDLAAVEKMSKTNLEALQDLRTTATSDLWGRLNAASAATTETYGAASSLRRELHSEGNDRHGGQGGHGRCGHGSHGAGSSERQRGQGHHWGWFSRGRGC